MLLENKTAFITGASRGIGKAVARLFASHRCNLILNARAEEHLKTLCTELCAEFGIACIAMPFDVTSYEQVKTAFAALIQKKSRVDILVNNAGLMKNAMLGMLQADAVAELFSTNAFGPLYMMQQASRLMMKAGEGSIINIASVVGQEGSEGQSAYAGSKAAIIGITKAAAKELSPYGIRCNAVAPGFIDTDLTSAFPEEKRKKIVANIRMKRAGTPEDVANCCLFFASDMSRYVTGQVLAVDGSMLI
jgi:3-oxoacyl-[acyl-carrier protein] reductase